MLAPEQRAFFAQQGFLIVRRAFSAERVEALRAALDAVLPPRTYSAGGGTRVLEIAGISRGAPAIAEHARDPLLGRLAAAVLGARRVQVLQDTALVKPAASEAAVAWHQDYSYLALDAPRAVTARLALTACTLENGCMRVIAGSHAWGALGPALSFRAPGIEDAFGGLPEALREHALHDEFALELEPGDVTLHHCLTLHGSGPNRSGEARKTILVRLVDSSCRLDPARLPDPAARAHFPTDAEGFLSPEAFPVVYEEEP